ncbi:MAG TPA: response regulator [Anaerolineae bacterium]|nr:response regulator [Anaerolineae bacterium]
MFDTHKTILIIEDSATQALALQSRLRKEGVEAICAWDGLVGVNMAYQVRPDLIVLDIQLPRLSGVEVCRKVRDTPEISHIPIIVLSSNNEPEMVANCKEAGATDYIHKDDLAFTVLVEVLKHMGLCSTGGQATH